MVGDRYLTDVAFGNKNGMLSIRCAPLTTEGEPITVWMVSVHISPGSTAVVIIIITRCSDCL